MNKNRLIQKDYAIAVVGDLKFLFKHLNKFTNSLKKNGNYDGDLIILTNKFSPRWLIKAMINYDKVKILKFSKIKFPKDTIDSYLKLNTNDQPNRFKYKRFQWFKLNLFDEQLKNWNFILYLDINMTIHHDINEVFKIKPLNSLYAKADSYPDYEKKLSTQFDITHRNYKELEKNFDLDDAHYFQTGLMYYDTSIIHKNMVKEIINMGIKYPLSITNEQGILNIYFQDNNLNYKEFPEMIDGKIFYYYWKIKNQEITITKQIVEKYK